MRKACRGAALRPRRATRHIGATDELRSLRPNSFGQSTRAGGYRIIHGPGLAITAVGHYRYVTGTIEPQTVFSASHHAVCSDGARPAGCDSHPDQQACSGQYRPNPQISPVVGAKTCPGRVQPSDRSAHSIRRPRDQLGFPRWPAGCHVSVVPAGRARHVWGDRRAVLAGAPA